MPAYGFSLIRIFSYKYKIKGSFHIREKAGHAKPVFWHILRSG